MMNTNANETMRSEKDFWFACTDIEVIRDKTLTPMSKYIFSVLCTFANLNNRTCWPSVETVADTAGVSSRTVRRAYDELEARGVIIRVSRYKDKAQISSQYFIVGHNASCYMQGVSDMSEGADTDVITPLTPMSYRTIPMNDINTLKGENDFPVQNSSQNFSDDESNHEADKKQNSQPLTDKPDEVCSIDDVPEAMKETAELLLLKTGRKKLTWEEISALRELNQTQLPSRVQKEISKVIKRFNKYTRPLKDLNFVYVAGCLRNQPTLGKAKKSKTENVALKSSNAELMPKNIQPCSDSEAEKQMARIAELEAKFDEGGQRR